MAKMAKKALPEGQNSLPRLNGERDLTASLNIPGGAIAAANDGRVVQKDQWQFDYLRIEVKNTIKQHFRPIELVTAGPFDEIGLYLRHPLNAKGDVGAYRSRTGVGIASTFGRNASGGSNLPSCRSSYSGVGSSSARAIAKERALTGFGGTFLKKDKFEEKPAFKYSCEMFVRTKDTDKSRLHPGRSSSEDVRAKSPLSDSRSSLLEKYSFSAGKTSERPSSVLDRYNRPASREKSREPEGISRYGSSTYPGSSFARSYGNDGRIEKKDHPPVSYRGLRSNSGKTSREPSPEVSVGKTNSYRVYSRAPSYGRSAASPSTSESSSATISTRFGSTAGSRFLSSRSGNERVSTSVNYPAGGRFRNLNSKSTNQKEEEEEEEKSRLTVKSDKDGHHELSKITNRVEENETNNKLPDNEFVTLTVVTRSTSPTPPASSSYVRNRRAEINVVHQKEVIRFRKLPDTVDEEVQCDQMEETSRFSRYGSNRVSGAPWSTYLDKYSGASSAGSPSIYSSRGFTNASSSSRLNNFAYTRTNEASATTKSESSAREICGSDTKSQNEKLLGLNCTTTNDETASNDSKTSSSGQDIHCVNKEDRIHGSERCCCGARKIETHGNSNLSNLRSSNQNLAFYRREDSTQDSQNASRCDDYNQRRPSIPRLERTSSKNNVKIPKCSSKTEITSSKSDAYSERRGSTPKSDASSSSRTGESLRIVEGHCQDQNEEIISQKRDVSQRKDSTSSGSSQSRSASTSQTRNVSTKNTPRQMTRTGSSDGSSVSMPIGRSKSSSASSVTSQGIKIKTTTPPSSGKSSAGSILPSVNLRQGGSPDARGKPPVPKNDTTTAATPKCTVATKYVNKDFRKSTLNMENGDLCSKYARRKKSQRNISVSAQDFETASERHGIEVIPVASADSQSTDNPVDNESLYSSKPLKKIRHVESGEKAWWMDSSSNVPDGVVRIPVEIPNSTSDSSESYEKIDIGVNPEPETCVKRSLSRFPIEFPPPPSEPLGDRASPEGVENPPDPPDNYGRKSPYDNVKPAPRRLPPRKRPSTLPLFIGEDTDIDHVLGDTAVLCYSPVLSRIHKQERVEEDSSEDNSECEEIDATQVIIHDSTPKTPVIQRRNRDNKRIQPDGYIPQTI
ncbi:Uncharacterized protein DBV15_11074 [Temnothorax longispinosus]|uniref:Uncharacterized protein n=1 Tax=Temnothorax longispinosus TaxID=300112 RepID=A0A4S2KNY9_9HYME|nr:Uncharacterized protein DBV15_11074 [Temnothorax longispinosus]